ncbi:ribonuclease H-like domain, reverse transcriptase, RNA-dependent DNA polymerase [Tanacetum coccineum]
MWEAIKTRNLGADRVKEARLQTLITEFENMKMSDNDSIDAYAVKLSGIASKSTTLEEVMSEHKLVKKFLTSLPRRFDHIVASLEQILDLKMTGFEDVVGRLKANNNLSRGRGRGSYYRGRGQGRGRGNSKPSFGVANLMHKLAKGVLVIKHQDQVCESCMVEKQTKKSFSKKATYRASRILEMVHGDICGPITPSTQAGTFTVLWDEKNGEAEQIWNNDATIHATVHDATVHGTVNTVSPVTIHETPFHVTSPEGDEDEYQSDVTPIRYDEPKNYNEAKLNPKWLKAMKTKLESIVKNNTWKLVPLPKGFVPIGLKWLFKIKRNANGSIMKYKACLVAKGYIQQPEIDFDEVFASVARLETKRLLIALAAGKGWKIHHLDVKMAFLHGELKEEVYVVQPGGFEKPGEGKNVYKIAKSLYGLRQAPKAWNIKLDNT